MRSLVILRGSPGSGKSTWVERMGLKNYTLCADDIRMLMESPILTPNGTHTVISQKNDKYVWQLLFEILEKRMERGEFVIVDATHSKSSDFSRYNKLCERYRYRRYYVDFSDVPIDECIRRNNSREEYKRVPEDVIRKMYSRLETQGKTSGWVEVDKNAFWETIGMKKFNFDKYDKIHVFGDIHGCYEPLKEYFEVNPYKENEFYLFTGDYIDRGIQNKEVLEFLMTLIEKPNVLFLEGNHERWLNYYSLDEYENIKSKTFLYKTAPQIADIDKSSIRKFYRKLGQIAYFEYDGNTYLVSHGGISYLPKELQLVATEQFINGVGDYNVNIDEVWVQNISDYTHKQIHAHRNTFEIDDVDNKSFNLEGKIEFGGCLRVFEVSHRLEPVIVKIKNNVFAKPEEANEYHECKAKIDMPILEQLRVSKDIKETPLEDNISSFNFTSRAFHNKHWNEATIKARGLFVDTEKDKVVARGYEKFFNVNERRETELEHLLVKFKDSKITCYKKENGFLGIMSYVNGKLFIASKSTNVGEFADMFRKIYEESDIDKQQLEKYLSENDVSLTFEVIDTINDPHLIKYDKSKLVLLDIIHNDYEFMREPYEKVVELSKLINCECKSVYVEFDNIRDFHRWYLENTDEDDLSKEDIEGVVIECNGIMTKLKFPYYKFWKFMRSLKDRIAKNKNAQIRLAILHNAEANYFYAWLKKQDEETLKQDIITLRDKYYSEVKND